MIDKKIFLTLRNQYDEYDKQREQLIIKSRTILKTSKQAIYHAQRNNHKEACTLLKNAKKQLKTTTKLTTRHIHLATTGAYLDALEEYIEATCFVHYLAHGTLPSPHHIGVDADSYLPALGDLVGELVRYAINSAIKGEHAKALQIKEDITTLYSELMLFDWRNSPARRKFDAIKYGLEKLDDLALKIQFKQ